MRHHLLSTTGRVVGLLVMLGIVVFPLYWMFVTSLTSDGALFGSEAQLFPDFTRLSTYADALTGNVPRWLRNSFIIAAGTCLLTGLMAIPFGYGLSRFHFRAKGAIGVG